MNAYETQYTIFNFVNSVLLILLVISFLGISTFAQEYRGPLEMMMQIYVAVFLIVRFNPFVEKPNFSPLDRKVAYSAGVFMLATTSIAKYFKSVTEDVTQQNRPLAYMS